MSTITDRMIDQAYSDLESTCGGVRNDYFGLLYLEKEFKVPRDRSLNQVAFGGNDYGIDGFYFDSERRNLYLFQFKYSRSYAEFKQSLQRLIDVGMERVFTAPNIDDKKNQVLLQLRSCMVENRAIIDQVCIRFVFTGDPEDAERSQVIDKLREDLENKKYLVNQFFKGREVTLVVEFRSAAGKVGTVVDQRKDFVYKLPMAEVISCKSPNGEEMYVGFARLVDFYKMYQEMKTRFFERNIRYGLGSSEAVNRAISRALHQIILDEKESPDIFSFNHNGITIFAEKIEHIDGEYHITAPRLLNGAQTITTFAEFIDEIKKNKQIDDSREALENLRVLCKVITHASQEFVTSVTINNNRQNPVEPWNLHANDLIQLELQDKLRDEVGIYYERQEDAFKNSNYEALEEEGITEESNAIKLLKLAQTFLVSDGNIAAFSNMRRIFEDDKEYNKVFGDFRSKADSRLIVLCYKIQLRGGLRKSLRLIEEQGPNKYWFIYRARNLLWALLCQGILNDNDLDRLAELYGMDLRMPVQYTDYLVKIASSRCRPIIAELVKDQKYADKVANEDFNFLRNNATFNHSMEIAHQRWKWVHKKLR